MKPRIQNHRGLTARSSNLLGLATIALCLMGAGQSMAQLTWTGATDSLCPPRSCQEIFLTHGLPNDFYTDGLSLFGHESRKAGDTDTLSQFQRALGCLGISHLVAKDPQSKGKVERQFGFWQKRLHALFAMESVSNRTQANELLATQIDWHHKNHTASPTSSR